MKRALLISTLILAAVACKKVDLHEFVAVTDIKLDQTNISLVIGDDITLHATLTPSNATQKGVKWSSSDGKVATVSDDGKVVAKKEGNATITATAESGGLKATCKVTVLKEVVPVTGVSIDPDDVVIKVGGTQRLSARLEPEGATNHKVSWKSSDEGVATVKDGLVTGVARGEATITVRTEDGGKEAFAHVKVVQSFTKVTITAPTTSDSHYDASKEKFIFSVGESFQLQATGEPAEADDEIEYRTYTYNAENYMEMDAPGHFVLTASRTNCEVMAYSKADPDYVYATLKFDILPKATSIELVPYKATSAVEVGGSRVTECIGVGAVQKFTVKVLPTNASQKVSIQSKTGSVTFTIDGDGLLVASCPSTASASNLSSTYTSKVTLRAAGNFDQSFNFKVTSLDPYQVKVGDVINKDGEIGDGGYRGVGIFENPLYMLKNINCMIAHLGSEHLTEDPLWSQYKPSPGLTTALGQDIHGIAIPINITKLYRTSQTGGEVYYTDSNNDNYIEDSGNLPDWVKTEARKSLLRSNSLKHSAFMNTCCHVHTNAGRGNSFEILPFNYFVEAATQKPSKDAGVGDSWWNKGYVFKNSFSGLDNGFNASSHSTECGLLGPWVLPTIADFNSVFTFFSSSSTGTGDFSDKEFTNNNQVKFKVEVLLHTLSVYATGSLSYNDIPMWLANETGQNKFVQGMISGDGASFQIRKSVAKNTRGYVFPVRYF